MKSFSSEAITIISLDGNRGNAAALSRRDRYLAANSVQAASPGHPFSAPRCGHRPAGVRLMAHRGTSRHSAQSLQQNGSFCMTCRKTCPPRILSVLGVLFLQPSRQPRQIPRQTQTKRVPSGPPSTTFLRGIIFDRVRDRCAVWIITEYGCFACIRGRACLMDGTPR